MLTTAMLLAALVYIGKEVPEGTTEGLEAQLDDALAEFDLTRDQFLTEPTIFAAGYHRGLSARAYTEEHQVPQADGKAVPALKTAYESGYGYGLEARDLSNPPSPSVLFQAHVDGKVKWGELNKFVTSLDLSQSCRLAHALAVGSGKNAVQIPAGTPVDVLGEIEKDGVPHLIVGYDGLALVVPNPTTDPGIVSGDTTIAAPAKVRKASTRKSKDGSPAAPKTPVERGPTLRDVIVHVFETGDGPLASNAVIAQRVVTRARELGIADKANTFLQKADKHVPYYLNCYRPDKDGKAGRLSVLNPLEWVIIAAEARKFFLKGGMAAVPAELVARMSDKETRRIVEAAPAATTEAAPAATTEAAPAATTEAAPAATTEAKGKKGKKSEAVAAEAK